MQFGYTIIYVPKVEHSLVFFEQAFGIKRRFLHESGTYGELETGSTTLAFADHDLAELNFKAGHVAAHSSPQPLGMELGLVTDDVHAAHARALEQGAQELAAPSSKPWGADGVLRALSGWHPGGALHPSGCLSPGRTGGSRAAGSRAERYLSLTAVPVANTTTMPPRPEGMLISKSTPTTASALN